VFLDKVQWVQFMREGEGKCDILSAWKFVESASADIIGLDC